MLLLEKAASFRISIFFTALICIAPLTGLAQSTESMPDKPANVILMIGDGMGLTQMSSIYYRDVETVHFDQMTDVGLLKTWSSNAKITDSASSATAYAAGIKTYNGALGVNSDTVSVESIVERISPKGIATGLIATSSITHATPAAFYAHVSSRSMHEKIARHLTMSEVDFFAGGGLKFFAKRDDGRNYFNMLGRHGFEADSTALKQPDEIDSQKKYGFLLADDGLPKMIEGRGSFLPDATELALHYFKQKEMPFFMMVEGSQIDWGGHQNSSEYLMTEVEDFNEALGRVLRFAEEDGNTLVIVTADHETGGFALSSGENYNNLNGTFSTGGHTATLIPIYAFGPGSSLFNGIFDNTGVYDKILEAAGW
ncbi:MAG: alkaline phosphatase [Rhodothermales bacterium]